MTFNYNERVFDHAHIINEINEKFSPFPLCQSGICSKIDTIIIDWEFQIKSFQKTQLS